MARPRPRGPPGQESLIDVALVAEQALTLLYGASLSWLEQRDDTKFRAVLKDAVNMVGRRLI